MRSKATYRPRRVVALSNRLIAQVFDGTYDQAKAFAMWRFGLDVHLTNWSALSDTVREEASRLPVFSCLTEPGGHAGDYARERNMAEAGGVDFCAMWREAGVRAVMAAPPLEQPIETRDQRPRATKAKVIR
jgi:hypothetical protein